MLYATDRYSDRYDDAQQKAFIERLRVLDEQAGADAAVLRDIFLGIYAGPLSHPIEPVP